MQDEGDSLSHHLITTIKETEFKNEGMILIAHDDRTPYGLEFMIMHRGKFDSLCGLRR